ncbi:MAG: hypothetical protein GWQ08_09055 [Verrucomicrobiaceae bacterium]|jgi:hypothetical protein|nr:hypothetical protein [Verrucomicrobiaceae bacterium]
MSNEAVAQEFTDEASRIEALIAQCPPNKRATPVLIERFRGIEDSSRYWSVYITLDHLRIVNKGITRIIEKLAAADSSRLREVSTADVKPNPRADESAFYGLQDSVRFVIERVRKINNFKTDRRHPHPWFGPLAAAGFHNLLAMHMKRHCLQIERIIIGIRAN